MRDAWDEFTRAVWVGDTNISQFISQFHFSRMFVHGPRGLLLVTILFFASHHLNSIIIVYHSQWFPTAPLVAGAANIL